jgi:hypothetical protein
MPRVCCRQEAAWVTTRARSVFVIAASAKAVPGAPEDFHELRQAQHRRDAALCWNFNLLDDVHFEYAAPSGNGIPSQWPAELRWNF